MSGLREHRRAVRLLYPKLGLKVIWMGVKVIVYGEPGEVMYNETFDTVAQAKREIVELIEEDMHEFVVKIDGKKARINLSIDLVI